MILCRQHGHHRPAISEAQKGTFLSVHEFFDDDLIARSTEFVMAHHFIDCIESFLFGHGNDDTLAGSKAVCLDDNRSAFFTDVSLRISGVFADFEESCRDPVLLHQFLGKNLRTFDFGSSGRRPEDVQPVSFEYIDDPGYERSLRPHHGQIDVVVFRPSGKTFQVGRIQADTFRQIFHPGTAGNRVQLFHFGALGQFPNDGVFPAAAANDKYLHR